MTDQIKISASLQEAQLYIAECLEFVTQDEFLMVLKALLSRWFVTAASRCASNSVVRNLSMNNRRSHPVHPQTPRMSRQRDVGKIAAKANLGSNLSRCVVKISLIWFCRWMESIQRVSSSKSCN
jgi:hypothetical protein